MSKIIYVCCRNGRLDERTRTSLAGICAALTPDNVTVQPHHTVHVNENVAYAISNDKCLFRKSGSSVLFGTFFGQSTGWEEPQTTPPDGSYAIFRDDKDFLEVISDAAASRTVWYFFDDTVFIAATSQRAITLFLRSFEFDTRVIPWILSTGSLGSDLSWDKRLKRLQPNSGVLLDKRRWNCVVKQGVIKFFVENKTRDQHKILLSDAIRTTVSSLHSLDYAKWRLLLSGGYDSRAILLFIRQTTGMPKDLKSITWGLREALNEEGNDANIAKELADRLGVHHTYYPTDVSQELAEGIIDRFLVCGEGRVDHLAGYLDGMDMWRQLHDSSVIGIIRGDLGFSTAHVASELDVRTKIGCAVCSDFKNLRTFRERFGFDEQKLPIQLQRVEGETLDGWRDRLYHAYRLPTVLAALSDIKLSYVEQITPFLSKVIIDQVRKLPDDLRNNKELFKEIVDTMGPDIPYATTQATPSLARVLRRRDIVELFKSKFESAPAIRLLGRDFLRHISNGIEVEVAAPRRREATAEKAVRSILRSMLPKSARNLLRGTFYQRAAETDAPEVDANVLAFRVYIVVRMHELLIAGCR